MSWPDMVNASFEAGAGVAVLLHCARLLRACRAPRFVAVKAVNSAHADGTVKCWVFSLN